MPWFRLWALLQVWGNVEGELEMGSTLCCRCRTIEGLGQATLKEDWRWALGFGQYSWTMLLPYQATMGGLKWMTLKGDRRLASQVRQCWWTMCRRVQGWIQVIERWYAIDVEIDITYPINSWSYPKPCFCFPPVTHLSFRSAHNTMGTRGTPE